MDLAATGGALRVLTFALACAAAACAPVPVSTPAPAPTKRPVAVRPLPAPPGCRAARDADFEGAGEQQLRRYLDWLAEAHGTQVALKPQQVVLAIVRGDAKPGPTGVQAAEVSCNVNDYRITLYRNALSGRPLAVTYDTLAHEFHHVVQIRRDRLACQAAKGERARYEREAVEFAQRLVPACRK